MMMNFWILYVGLGFLCVWVLMCYFIARERLREDVARIQMAVREKVLRDMVTAYNHGDWREMMVILGSARFSNGEGS
ncbi:hypothetical protein ES703_97883 [subsurface metagenome]